MTPPSSDSLYLLQSLHQQGWNHRRIEAALANAVILTMERKLSRKYETWNPVTAAICKHFREAMK